MRPVAIGPLTARYRPFADWRLSFKSWPSSEVDSSERNTLRGSGVIWAAFCGRRVSLLQYLRHGRCHMREGAGAQPASKTAYQAAFSRHPQQLLGAHLIEGDVSHPDLRHRAESRAEADIDIMAGVLENTGPPRLHRHLPCRGFLFRDGRYQPPGQQQDQRARHASAVRGLAGRPQRAVSHPPQRQTSSVERCQDRPGRATERSAVDHRTG